MKTVAIKLSIREIVKLLTMCNAAIVAEEKTLSHLPSNGKAKELTEESLLSMEAIKAKVMAAICEGEV